MMFTDDTARFLLQLVAVHIAAGTVLAGAVWLAMRALPGLNASTRHAVWLMSLTAVMLMPLLAFTPEFLEPSVDERAVRVSETAAMPASGYEAPSGSTDTRPTETASVATDDAGWTRAAGGAMALIWLGGIVLMSLRLRHSLVLAGRLRADSEPAAPEVRSWFDDARRALGIRQPVDLRIASAATGPLTVGLTHPWVALPRRIPAELPPAALEHALWHELAHVKRRDPWVNLLERIAEILYFYNPAVHLISRELELARESACDDWAIQHSGGARAYADSLLDVFEGLRFPFRPLYAAGCVRGKSQLAQRISHLLDKRSDHSPRRRGPVLAMAGVLLGAGLAGSAWALPRPVDLGLAPSTASASGLSDMLSSATDLSDVDWAEYEDPVDPDMGLLGAAWSGDRARVERLLAEGADPNQVFGRRSSPRTALNAALHSQHFDIARRLVEAGARVDRVVRGDAPPLTAAARAGSVEMVRLLLDRGAPTDQPVEGDGTALISASARGDIKMVELLLARGADPDLYVDGDESPVFKAAAYGHLDVLRRLVAAGADVDREYEGDGTALMIALKNGYRDVAEFLMDQGADLSAFVEGDGTPLIQAVRHGDLEVVRFLLDRGAHVDQAAPGDGSALINAAADGDVAMMRLLLDRGADPNHAVRGDDTPLINAVRSGEIEAVRLLLDNDADPNQKGDPRNRRPGRRTPLGQAERHGHDAIRDLLLNRGAVDD